MTFRRVYHHRKNKVTLKVHDMKSGRLISSDNLFSMIRCTYKEGRNMFKVDYPCCY